MKAVRHELPDFLSPTIPSSQCTSSSVFIHRHILTSSSLALKKKKKSFFLSKHIFPLNSHLSSPLSSGMLHLLLSLPFSLPFPSFYWSFLSAFKQLRNTSKGKHNSTSTSTYLILTDVRAVILRL